MLHLPYQAVLPTAWFSKKLSLTTFLLQTVRLGLLTPRLPYFCLMAALSSPMPVLANLTVLSLLALLLTVEVLPVEAVVVPALAVLVVAPVAWLAVVPAVLLCCAFCAAKARSSAALVAA